jgi:capsular polysaccharide transport system permease protein
MSSLHRLQSSWAVQVRVIHALMIRELLTRFGRENIGFLWIMAEPLLFAGLVGVLWHFTHGATEHGISVIAFVATGYIPITLFRHGVARSMACFTVNQSLLYHRQIKIVDFILARFIIEILGGMMAYLFMAVVLIGFGEFPMPADIGLLIAGWLLYAYFCFGVCLIIAPLSVVSEAIHSGHDLYHDPIFRSVLHGVLGDAGRERVSTLFALCEWNGNDAEGCLGR